MYPENLFSSDLVWPCDHDMDSGQYILHIAAQIEEAYNFLSEALARVSAQVLLQCYLEYYRAM